MRWNIISVTTKEKYADLVSSALLDAGAQGVQIEGGSFDEAEYEELRAPVASTDDVTVKAYFGEDGFDFALQNTTDSLKSVKNKEDSDFLYSITLSDIEDTDWNENFKKNFKAFRAAGNIIIKPTWESFESVKGDIVIEMDPGMAFGSGDHETTKMCLELIQRYLKKGDNVMDVGCGSGILGIACAKLGAANVLALDNDSVSVKVARENAAMNEVNIEVRKSDLLAEAGEGRYGLIIANIVADIIIRLNTGVPKYLNPESVYIVSGIIADRLDDVLNSLQKNRFSIIETKSMGEWRAIAAKLKGYSL